MILKNDIRIMYLKLLKREPMDNEMVNALNTDIVLLEENIKSTYEYIKQNNYFFADTSFDIVSNIFSYSNVINDKNDKAFYLANDYLNMYSLSMYNEFIDIKITDNFKEYIFENICNVQFTESEAMNATKRINLDEAYVTDVFEYEDKSILVDKYCLHSFKTCFLQNFKISSKNEQTIQMKHVYKSHIRTYVKYFYSQTIHFSEVDNGDTIITNMYLFDILNFDHFGHNYHENIFNLHITNNTEQCLSILTSVLHKDNRNDMDNDNILLNLLRFSIPEIINGHTTCWNRRWKNKYTFDLKEFVSNRSEKEKLLFSFNYSLYILYSNIYTKDLLYNIPNLLVMHPICAIQVIKSYINYLKKDFNTAKYYSKNGSFLTFDKDKIGLQVNQSALLNIHMWNYYRISKNKNWLHVEGYPLMRSNTDFLLNCIENDSIHNSLSLNNKQSTNNAFTIHITKLAIEMTNKARLELDLNDNYDLTTNISLSYLSKEYLTSGETNITIKCEEIHTLLCYTFYSTIHDQLIGYRFSKDYGYQLELGVDREITFHFHESILKKPILFYDINGLVFRHKFSESLSDSVLSQIQIGSTDDSITINSDKISGYSCLDKDKYKNDMNTVYGKNAFTPQHIIDETDHVIELHSDFTKESNPDATEVFLLLSNYYNESINNVQEKVVQNTAFYDKNVYSSGTEALLSHGLDITLAQTSIDDDVLRTFTEKYTQSMIKLNKYKVLGDINNNSIIVYTILFNILGFRFDTITDHLLSTTNNSFPEDIKQISFKNGTQDIVLTNLLNQSFNNLDLVDVLEYEYRYRELYGYVDVVARIKPIYPIFVNDDLQLFIENDIKPKDYFTTPGSNVYRLSYIEKEEISNDVNHIDDLTNIYMHVLLQNNNYSDMIVTHKLDVINTVESNLIFPTILVSFDYVELNTFNISLKFNSQENNKYILFNTLDILLEYDSVILKIKPEADNYGFHTDSNCQIDILQDSSNIHLSYSNDVPISTGKLDIGTIRLDLNAFEVFTRITPTFPLKGTLSIDDMKKTQIYFDKSNYPPSLQKLVLHINFSVEKYIIERFETYNIIHSEVFIPMNHLLSSGNNVYEQLGHGHIDDTLNEQRIRINENIKTNLRELDHARELNQFLDLNNKKLLNIVSGTNTTLFKIIDNITKSIDFYGIGMNNFDMLMLNNHIDTEVLNITKCIKLNEFFDSQNLPLEKYNVTQSRSCTVIYSVDDVFVIGDNSSYNLGIEEPFTFEIIESNRIKQLLLSTDSKINILVLNNESTFLYLDNNKLYGLGENVMFKYLTTTSDTIWVEYPTELDVINIFLATHEYIIDRIEGGSIHLKFLLISLKTGKKEWWGIGRNRFNSMCLTPDILEHEYDIDIKHLVRLNQIESFIHGKEYDLEYNGVHAQNSNKVKLIPNNGLSALHTAIFDQETKEVYVIGTLSLNDSDDVTMKTWTKWISYADVLSISEKDIEYDIYMLVLNICGIFIGISDNTEYIQRYYQSGYIQCLVIDKSHHDVILAFQNTSIYLLNVDSSATLTNELRLSTENGEYTFTIEYKNEIVITLDNIEITLDNTTFDSLLIDIKIKINNNQYIFETRIGEIPITFELAKNKRYVVQDTHVTSMDNNIIDTTTMGKIVLKHKLVFKNFRYYESHTE